MTCKELERELEEMHKNANRDKSAQVILFGIKYAKELEELKRQGISPEKLAQCVFKNTPYATEIRKGMKLAKYVCLRK